MTAPDPVAPPPAPATPGGDWPAQAADTIVNVVGMVREATTDKAVTAARGVVYGTLAAILGTVALVVSTILLVRVLDILVNLLLGLADLDRPGRSVWIAHLIVGLLFVGLGASLFKKGRTAPAD